MADPSSRPEAPIWGHTSTWHLPSAFWGAHSPSSGLDAAGSFAVEILRGSLLTPTPSFLFLPCPLFLRAKLCHSFRSAWVSTPGPLALSTLPHGHLQRTPRQKLPLHCPFRLHARPLCRPLPLPLYKPLDLQQVVPLNPQRGGCGWFSTGLNLRCAQ